MTHLLEVNSKFIRAVEGDDEKEDNKVHLPTSVSSTSLSKVRLALYYIQQSFKHSLQSYKLLRTL